MDAADTIKVVGIDLNFFILSGGIDPGYTILADLQLDFMDKSDSFFEIRSFLFKSYFSAQ